LAGYEKFENNGLQEFFISKGLTPITISLDKEVTTTNEKGKEETHIEQIPDEITYPQIINYIE